ncbi:MAG: hypothetical protein MHM6MM_000295 [Cercozoa sp. M6MM]
MEKILKSKAAGNAAFKQKKWHDAIAHYSAAVAAFNTQKKKKDLDPTLSLSEKARLLQVDLTEVSKIFGNRAQVQLNLDQYAEAIADCAEALELDPTNVKAVYRRGLALEKQGFLAKAMAQYSRACDMVPTQKTFRAALQRVATEARLRQDRQANTQDAIDRVRAFLVGRIGVPADLGVSMPLVHRDSNADSEESAVTTTTVTLPSAYGENELRADLQRVTGVFLGTAAQRRVVCNSSYFSSLAAGGWDPEFKLSPVLRVSLLSHLEVAIRKLGAVDSAAWEKDLLNGRVLPLLDVLMRAVKTEADEKKLAEKFDDWVAEYCSKSASNDATGAEGSDRVDVRGTLLSVLAVLSAAGDRVRKVADVVTRGLRGAESVQSQLEGWKDDTPPEELDARESQEQQRGWLARLRALCHIASHSAQAQKVARQSLALAFLLDARLLRAARFYAPLRATLSTACALLGALSPTAAKAPSIEKTQNEDAETATQRQNDENFRAMLASVVTPLLLKGRRKPKQVREAPRVISGEKQAREYLSELQKEEQKKKTAPTLRQTKQGVTFEEVEIKDEEEKSGADGAEREKRMQEKRRQEEEKQRELELLLRPQATHPSDRPFVLLALRLLSLLLQTNFAAGASMLSAPHVLQPVTDWANDVLCEVPLHADQDDSDSDNEFDMVDMGVDGTDVRVKRGVWGRQRRLAAECLALALSHAPVRQAVSSSKTYAVFVSSLLEADQESLHTPIGDAGVSEDALVQAALALAKLAVSDDDVRGLVLEGWRIVDAVARVMLSTEEAIERLDQPVRGSSKVGGPSGGDELDQLLANMAPDLLATGGSKDRDTRARRELLQRRRQKCIEALAFLSLHLRVKHRLASVAQGKAVPLLYKEGQGVLHKVLALAGDANRAVRHGVLRVLHHMVTSKDDRIEEATKEVEELRKAAARGLPNQADQRAFESHAGEEEEVKPVRVACVNADAVAALVCLHRCLCEAERRVFGKVQTAQLDRNERGDMLDESKAHSMSVSDLRALRLRNARERETMAHVLYKLASVAAPDARGRMLQQGGLRLALDLYKAFRVEHESQDNDSLRTGRERCAAAAARIGISVNPALLPDGLLQSLVPVWLHGVANASHELAQFEMLLALTNAASLSPEMRDWMHSTQGAWSTIRALLGDENKQVECAALECLANLCLCDEGFNRFERDAKSEARTDLRLFLAFVKAPLLMTDLPKDELRRQLESGELVADDVEQGLKCMEASLGALAMLVQIPAVARAMQHLGGDKLLRRVQAKMGSQAILYRAEVALQNMAEALQLKE